MDLKTHAVTNNDSNPKHSDNVLTNLYVNCLLLAKNSTLYVGTYDGLYCLNLKTKSYINNTSLGFRQQFYHNPVVPE